MRAEWSAARRIPNPAFRCGGELHHTIRGSFVGTRQDMAEALAFAAEGKVKADIEQQPLSAINQVLERLEHGKVASHVVLDFMKN